MNNSVNPNLLTDEQFAEYRYKTDDDIDDYVVKYLTRIDSSDVFLLLEAIDYNEALEKFKLKEKTLRSTDPAKADLLSEALSSLKNYFEDDMGGPKQFAFSDEEEKIIKDAAVLFNTHMTECTLALALRSLLKQYAAYNATNVLVYTQLLPKYPHRRIISTMQFVMDVMDADAFGPNQFCLKAIKKLRLVHSMVRARIRSMHNNPGIPFEFQFKEWGDPINQQDMLFAIHTFSIEVIKGLLASGEKISNEEIQNYYLAWHLIGRALGLDSKINPTDYHIGCEIQERIYAKEFKTPNPNGEKLAEPLLQFLQDSLPSASRESILGLVKLFNDEKDYEPIFKNILKVDLSEANDYYTFLYKSGDWLLHLWLKIKYFFFPASKKSDYLRDLASKNHKFFSYIINTEKTWTNQHFRVSDGFSQLAAKVDQSKIDTSMPGWKKLLNKILPSWLLSILKIKQN